MVTTWKDVENRYKSKGDYFRNYLTAENTPCGSNFRKFLEGFRLDHFANTHRMDSFEWFERLLLEPDEKQWQIYAFVHGLMHLDARRFAGAELTQKWLTALQKDFPEEIVELFQEIEGERLFGLFEPREQDADSLIKLFVAVGHETVRKGDAAGMRLGCSLCDTAEIRSKPEFEAVWNGYLRMNNLFQFMPYTFFVTTEGLAGRSYEGLRLKEAASQREAKPGDQVKPGKMFAI